MTTTLRASDPAAFLGIVPTLAGFTPRRSIVLLPFRGTRTEGARRLDPPEADAPLGEYVSAVLGLIGRVQGTDALAVVVYTDDPPEHTRDGLVLPQAVTVDGLRYGAAEAGLRVVEALCVTPSGWASYLDEEPTLQPLDTIPAAPVSPTAEDVSGDQFDGAELPRADLAEKEGVGRALRAFDAFLEEAPRCRPTGGEDPRLLAALRCLDDIPAFFESVLTTPVLPPYETAALLWCLRRPLLRDTALLQWATDLAGGARTLQAQADFASSREGIPDDLGLLFLGHGPAPDGERLRQALTAVREAAARAPRASRPAPLTAAAWLSWALGRATHAGRYLEMARAIDPEYGLAVLLDDLISHAVLPEWAFRRRAE
jgi:hypothetical protein